MPYPEELVALEAFWQIQRGDRALPSRADFAPENLRPWLGNLAVVVVERDAGLRFRVALSGTRLDDYYGRDTTGDYVDTPSQAVTGALPHYLAGLDSRQPIRFLDDNSDNSAIYRTMAKLLLPLSEDGDTVSRFLVAVYPLRADDAPDHLDLALAG